MSTILAPLLVRRPRRSWWRAWREFQLVGPLFYYDLARLAQRGRTTQLRCFFAALLALCLAWVVSERFPSIISRPFDLQPHLSRAAWTQLSHSFVTTVLVLQGLAALVLAPAYLANAFTEEIEHKTLEMLFTTELSDHELVLGKLLGRVTHLATVLFTGLPILSIMLLWGGVDSDVLIVGYLSTGLALLSMGSISILCSVLCRTTLAAVVSSYAVVAPLTLFCLTAPLFSPILFSLNCEDRVNEAEATWVHERDTWNELRALNPTGAGRSPVRPDPTIVRFETLGAYAIPHCLIFVICTILAVHNLRAMCLVPGELLRVPVHKAAYQDGYSPPGGDQDILTDLVRKKVRLERGGVPVAAELLSSWGPDDLPRKSVLPADFHPWDWPQRRPAMSVKDPPLLWKELALGTSECTGPAPRVWVQSNLRWLVYLFLGLAGVSWVMYRELPDDWNTVIAGLGTLIRIITIGMVALWGFLIAVGVAGCISRERDQQTLEGLFTLPVDREEILDAKWQGGILRYGLLGYGLGIMWWIGLALGALHPLSLLLLAGGCAVYLTFITSVGVFLSLVNRNTLWANMSMALVVLLLACGTAMALIHETYPQPVHGSRITPPWQQLLGSLLVNPGHSLWFAGFSWDQLAHATRVHDAFFFGILRTLPASLSAIAALTLALWLFTCRRFAKEVERTRR